MIEWFKNLRSTEKGKKFFKLALYMIFLFFVFLICIFANSLPSSEVQNASSILVESKEVIIEEDKERTYLEKQQVLTEGKYEFNYKVMGPKEVTYYGSFAGGRVDGLKETDGDLIRYSIEAGIVYIHSFNDKEPYDLLYEGLDPELFDFKNLFAKLNSSSAKIEKTEQEKIYNYESLDEYTYKVITDDDAIEEIDIVGKEANYTFTFDY